jgi:hypothetical protein
MAYSSFTRTSTIRVYPTPRFQLPVERSLQVLQPGTSSLARRSLSVIIRSTDFECRTRHDRQALRFVCDCKACLTGTPFQQLSDMRRTLIRGLQYLTLGVDLNGQRQGSASPIIVDSKLKKAAEDFSIPLSARLIYNLLVVYLLEEEGLLDDFMVERFNPGILQTTALFKTESNARIARLAITQETWLEKFCMAFRLYGRGDVADHAIAVGLRMLYGFSVKP